MTKKSPPSWALPGTKVNEDRDALQEHSCRQKYMVKFDGRTIHFGAKGYEDYTTHKDPERKARYLARHSGEDWSEAGVNTAGFWAGWLL